MSDLELLQAIEALAQAIATRPVKRWLDFVLYLVECLRSEFVQQNRGTVGWGRDYASSPSFVEDVYVPIVDKLRTQFQSHWTKD